MILRELIALVITKMDDNGLRQIESRLFRLRTQIGDSISRIISDNFTKYGEESARLEDARQIMEMSGMSLAKLRKETRGLYSDMSLVINFNKAQQFDIGESFTRLATIADAAGKKFGVPQEKALDDLIVGLTQGRNARLDNIGIIVDWKKEFDKAATALGIKKKDLSKEDNIKIGMAAVERMAKGMLTASGSIKSQSDVYDQMTVIVTNLRTSVGFLANIFAEALTPTMQRFLTYLTEITKKQSVREFFKDLGVAFGVLLKVTIGLASIFIDLFVILTKIPYASTAIAGLTVVLTLLLALIAGIAVFKMAAFGAAIGGVVASVNGMIWVFGGVVPLLAAFASTALPIIAILGILAATFSEVSAAASPEKLGFFEEWGNDMDKFREKMWEANWAEDGFWWNSFFGGIHILTVFYDVCKWVVDGVTNVTTAIAQLIVKVATLGTYESDWLNMTVGGNWLSRITGSTDAKKNMSSDAFKDPEQLAFETAQRRHRRFANAPAPTVDPGMSYADSRPNMTYQVTVDASGQQMTPVQFKQTIFDAITEHNEDQLRETRQSFTRPR